MSRLLARIMLALLMLPLAAVVYTGSVILLMDLIGYSRDVLPFFTTNCLTGAFIAFYWIMLWRGTVRWTNRRIMMTIGAAVSATIAGVAVGIPFSIVDDSFSMFIGGVFAMLLWLALTVFIWRESTAERAERMRHRTADALICPSCGYNMTGLGQASCPECGASYTISELMALQPSREQEDIASRPG